MFRYVTLLALWIALLGPSLQDAVKEFAEGNHEFTSEVYSYLSIEEDGNIVVSPFSAEVVLSLVTDGAKGHTATELLTGVSLPNSTEDRHAAFKSVLPSLKKSTSNFQLLSANRIYLAKRFVIKKSFEEIATTVYQSDVKNVDFRKTSQTAKTINSWIESRTNKKIRNLITPDSLTAETVMVLVNTLYLNGKWVTPFDVRKTAKEPFHTLDGDIETVQTMHSKDSAQYKYFYSGHLKTKFLELPYKDNNISMTFVLPDDEDAFIDMEIDLEPYLTPIRASPRRVLVAIPRFTTSTTINFDEILSDLDVKTAFSSVADFSGISSQPGLKISSVIQKAFINVTEIGTEAAAATGVTVSTTSLLQPPSTTFIANHSFMYYIRDDDSGSILFVGRYIDGR